MSDADWQIEWIDFGREPKEKPNPKYPDGIDIDSSDGNYVYCQAQLKCPAPRCGAWRVKCRKCGASAYVTTAGRADDPRSLKLACSYFGMGRQSTGWQPLQ